MRSHLGAMGLVTALFTLLSLTGVDVANAHTKKWKTSVVARIPLPREVSGTVRSPEGACRERQRVRLIHRKGKAGRTTAAGTAVASRDGSYAIAPKVASAPGDVWIVEVQGKVLRRSAGHLHLCRPSRSSVPAASTIIQAGNDLPRALLRTKRSRQLVDNRLGAHLYPNGLWREIRHAYTPIRDEIIDRGVKRLHTSLFEVEPPIIWESSEHEIPPEYDRLIDEMRDNGITVDYLLHFWDKEGHARKDELTTPRFETAEQVEDFIDYVRFVVRHFRGRIQYYTIWSEPDYCDEGGIKCVQPEDYIELARRVIPVIREEDPQAKVGLAPVVLFFARDDLLTILRSDVAAMFDMIQWHGQYSVAPDDAFYGSYYYDYPALIEQIKETASAHGFRGEYWSTEMGWCSADESPTCRNPDHPWGIVATDKLAAKYYARGIVMHRGMDVGVGVGGGIGEWRGPWSYPTRRYFNTIMAGATPAALPVEIEGAGTSGRIQSYGFSLPGGDRLFAVWTDGTAVEEDRSQNATLTFRGMSMGKVVGMDVLYGFEQKLVAETRSGDLIIRNLAVKDYPTILRIRP